MAYLALPELLYFPETLARDQRISWELQSKILTGGRTLSGVQTITSIDGGGFWTCAMGSVQVSTPSHVRAWRAISGRMDGGATPIVLTNRDEIVAPWPTAGTYTAYQAAHDDDASFSDGSVYVSNQIVASVYSGADLRATSLTLQFTAGAALQGGEYFSIEHQTFSHRLYRVVSVDTSGSNPVVTIRPPLREAVTAGTVVDFDNPKCVMRLATPDAMDLMLERRIFGQVDVRWVEAFPPWP